jgi:class 3 adenylate cyclase
MARRLMLASTLFLAIAVLVALALLLYGILAQQAASSDLSTLQRTFAGVASYLANVIRGYLNETLGHMRVIAQFAAARNRALFTEVDSQFFERFVSAAALQTGGGATIAWAPRVLRANLSGFVDAVRRSNNASADFTVALQSDSAAGGVFVAGDPDAVFPVLFSTPFGTPRGINLASSAAAADAIARARATGATAVVARADSPVIEVYEPAFSYDDVDVDGSPLFVGVTLAAVNIKFIIELTLLIATMNYTTGNVDRFQVRWLNVTDLATNASTPLYTLHDERFGNSSVNPLLASNTTVDISQHRFLLEQGIIGELPTQLQPTTIVLGAVVFAGVVGGCIALLCFYMRLDREKRRRQLLAMVVPEHVVAKLIPHLLVAADGDAILDNSALVADIYRNVTLCFIDICDFTAISSLLPPSALVRFLDELVSLVDSIVVNHPRILKIKTIGDAYFVAAGVHQPRMLLRRQSVTGEMRPVDERAPRHEHAADDADDAELRGAPEHVRNLVSTLRFALDVQRALQAHRFRCAVDGDAAADAPRTAVAAATAESLRVSQVLADAFDKEHQELRISVRIGVHMGDVVAGVVGTRRPQYDVWGDACNVAARIESSALNGTVQISHLARNALLEHGVEHLFDVRKREQQLVLKGLGTVDAYTIGESRIEWKDAMA